MQLTSLLGREHETRTLSKLWRSSDARLVTITGPGGVGKTSLALQVAHDLQDAFTDGVFFISLAAIIDSTLIIPTLAHTLGVIESPNRLLFDSLKDFLQNKQTLLLLDNFEQIISAAPLLSELLSACAELRILVTSREALRLRGEHEFPLSPLAVPDRPSIETLLQYPGIALFVERAQAIQPDFQLTPDNANAVTEICRRLDGLPLAIELASARIKLLSPHAMLEQMSESSLGLLTGGARDLPARQQTLRGTVQWSYDLLNADEKRVFRWLSVFVGGCTFDVAKVICVQASLDNLDSLVNKSLLRQHEIDHSPRLGMLETIREFGLEQLNHTHELEAARRTHAGHYLSFAEEAEPHLSGADQKTWLQRVAREEDNLRTALHWAIEHHEGVFAQRMAGALQPFWFARGQWSEGRRWLEESLATDSDAALDHVVRAKALHEAGVLARYQGDYDRARMLGEQSLALYRALTDQSAVLMVLVHLARTCGFQDDQPAMQAFLAEAASLIEALPDSVVKAGAYDDMAILMLDPRAGQLSSETAHYLDESERIHRTLDNHAGLGLVLVHQAVRAFRDGNYTQALSRFDEAETLALELGDERLHRLHGLIAANRGLLDLRTGNFAAARRHLAETFQQAGVRGDMHLPGNLLLLAIILHRQGLDAWSAQVLGLAESRDRTGRMLAQASAVNQFLSIGDIHAELRAELGDEAFARELAAGKRLTLDDLQTIPYPPEPVPATRAVTAASFTSVAPLTAREIEVLRLLAQDLSNLQIAERLVVSRRTVDAHLRSIYDKLGVKSRDAAIRVAGENRLI